MSDQVDIELNLEDFKSNMDPIPVQINSKIGDAITDILKKPKGNPVDADPRFKHVFQSRRNYRVLWSGALTDIFYNGLSKYGPNFTQIQTMLPNFTRHQILLKYRHEMRYRPFEVALSIQVYTKSIGKKP